MNDTTASDLRCYFGFRSPYSRLGLHKLARAGFTGDLIPFIPSPESGFVDPLSNSKKRDYLVQDVYRMTVRQGLPLALPDPFDPDYAPSNAAFHAASAAGQGMAFALAVSDLRWGQGLDISKPDVLAKAAMMAEWEGFDPDALPTGEALNAILDGYSEQADADGVFGVPFLIDGADKYWGHDRFDLWLEAQAG